MGHWFVNILPVMRFITYRTWFTRVDFFDFFVLLLFCRWREISIDWFFSFWHNYLQREEPLWIEKCCVYNNFCAIHGDYTTSRDMISLTDRQFAAYLFRGNHALLRFLQLFHELMSLHTYMWNIYFDTDWEATKRCFSLSKRHPLTHVTSYAE